MSEVWAMIQNGAIINTIIASDSDIKDQNYIWINITNIVPMPSIGWTYDGSNFNGPQSS